jgi:hypothetical protein
MVETSFSAGDCFIEAGSGVNQVQARDLGLLPRFFEKLPKL